MLPLHCKYIPILNNNQFSNNYSLYLSIYI